jgi:LPXTG-motif cell wall-anchored protein
MTRLAGITSLYALIAALLLVTPLSASQDPVPEPAAPGAVEQPQEPLPDPGEPTAAAPQEAAPAEPAPESAAAAPQDAAPADPAPQSAAPVAPAAAPESAAPPGSAPASDPAAAPHAEDAPAQSEQRRSGDSPRATAAADTGVTIRDFEFAPGGVTVDVGDTVTWSNEGPTPHSATADDGSFDTGIFDAGQSRSHTFDQAGTFAYFCTPHPNMRGTITVRAAAGGGNGAGGGGTTGGESGTTGGDTSGTGSGTSGDSSGSALPATGLDTGGLVLLGLVTVALGAFLRRRAAAAE